MSRNKHIGSRFDDFLAEEGLLEDANATAAKRVIAWQLAEAMKQAGITKTEMAARMHTSRAAVNRVLDENDALHEVEIKTGLSDGIRTEVVSGLKEGDKVVTAAMTVSAVASDKAA